MLYGGNQLRIARKCRSDYRRETNHQQHQDKIEREHYRQYNTETVFHPLAVTMSVVVAGHRYKTLGKSCKWHTDQLHSTL